MFPQLQPLLNPPPFHVLTSQFCTAVSIDTGTAIVRFFLVLDDTLALVVIVLRSCGLKPELSWALRLGAQGLGLKFIKPRLLKRLKLSLSQDFQAKPGLHITNTNAS